MEKTNEQTALRVSLNTIIANLILSAFKLMAGIFGNSLAMISDAADSLADVFSTIGVMIGIKLANRKPDKEHPYGHERFESAAAIILAAVLFATGVGIGWAGVGRIVSGTSGEQLEVPGVLALAAAVVSIVVKEGLYRYTRAAAKKLNSSILMANALNFRSDGFLSVGSLVGILGARLGLPILDPLACLVICVFILKAAVSIFTDAMRRMTDTSCDDEFVAELKATVLEQKDVLGIDRIMTRMFGDKTYVDVEISVDGTVALSEAHKVAERVHDVIEARFPDVKHCMVHVNPAEPEKED